MSRCSICEAPVPADSKWKPFCSERCRLTDLGRWFGGDYRIAGAPNEQTAKAAPGSGASAPGSDEPDADRG